MPTIADAIAEIKSRLPIADIIGKYIPLQPLGGRLVAACPFHDETKPSFSVYPEGNSFYCYGCQKHGDVLDFWEAYHGVGYREALETLAEMAHVQLPEDKRTAEEIQKDRERRGKRRQALEMCRFAQERYQKNLSLPEGAACREYLDARGVPEEMRQKFGLGWAMDSWEDLAGAMQSAGFDMKLAAEAGLVGTSKRSGRPYDPFRARLMFPIRDSAGTVIAFGGRILGSAPGQAKYVNTADSIVYKKGEHVYGLDLAGQAMRRTGRALVTEGYMDVLALHQFGFENAVAGLGTALTDRQAKRIMGYASEIVLVYDGDAAGRKAALAASEKFLAEGAKTRVVLLPEGEDADSMLRRPGGPEAFKRLLAQAKPAVQFCMETVREWAPKDAIRWCRDFVRSLRLPAMVSPAISYLARHLSFDESELRKDVEKAIQQDVKDIDRQPPAPDPAGRIPQLSPIETDILRCAVRYPECIGEIAEMGGGFFLASPFARRFWEKLSRADPSEAGYSLEGGERICWDKWRGPNAAPRTNAASELNALGRGIGELCAMMNAEAIKAVHVRREEINAGTLVDELALKADVAEAYLKAHPAPDPEDKF